MPRRSADKRIQAYELGLIPDVVQTKLNAKKNFMVEQEQAMQTALVTMEDRIAEILDNEGIIGNFRIPYLNFGRTLFRAKGHNSGVALQKIASAEKAKWVALGCDPAILDKIATVVIGETPY